MPLPRFDRLPAERQELILGVARRHFADHGVEGASYNKIIEAAGFSKTAAYHYFDGREDLLSAVLDGVLGRLLGALGPWVAAHEETAFWSRLDASSGALAAHLRDHPDDLALADAAIGNTREGPWLEWFDDLVSNGQRLGVIRTDVDHGLLVTVTAAVVRAADAWALARMKASPTPADLVEGDESAQLWGLLRGLWSETSSAFGEGFTDAH
ncbi:TetR/AcrR family transcriptional regulator [Streptomyces sp. C11-1]|uniref:TetR/AcrR family transcriptional regulator n=1 Tax=Streptomyces durocortorensis TaxID=2811104 RepID=A0ABY9VNJ5_9ACTN|nr:TetR/AcrR family transcriptional regulator [Streptomyces durocortorensis]WNF25489.1 TetR/AcrR family transcriptional regulator [Streptomyces durocortorensis]